MLTWDLEKQEEGCRQRKIKRCPFRKSQKILKPMMESHYALGKTSHSHEHRPQPNSHVFLPPITSSQEPVRHQELANQSPGRGHANTRQATKARLSALCLQRLSKHDSMGLSHGKFNQDMKIEPYWLHVVATLE